MKNLISIIVLVLGIYSCETQPPMDPNKINLKTGEVLIRLNFFENTSLNALKIVQLEDFANVSCTPCLISNKIIESLSKHSEFRNQLNVIKFPTNFPSPVDPMYLTAKQFCDYRMSFYQILFAPTIIIDGIIRPVPTDSNQIKNAIQQRLQTSSDFQISVSKETQDNGLIININIATKNLNSADLENLFLRIALVETEVEYTTPPGSNGETKFFDVLRIMLPSNSGYKLSEIKGSNSFSFENSIDSTWNLSKLKPVAFIQNSTTKEIIQSSTNN